MNKCNKTRRTMCKSRQMKNSKDKTAEKNVKTALKANYKLSYRNMLKKAT